MAYRISDQCISCGTCAAECPVSCIKEGEGQYVIDENTCIECTKSRIILSKGKARFYPRFFRYLVGVSFPTSLLTQVVGCL